MAGSIEPWWIIGSAAVALHLGRCAIDVADIDVLAHPSDANRLLASTPWLTAPTSDGRFRSVVFGRIDDIAPAIEVMAGLEVNSPAGWTPVQPATRQWVQAGSAVLPIPEVAELSAILLSFGRAKDRRRAALLDGR